MAKQLSICVKFLEAQRMKTLEKSRSTTPSETGEDKENLSHFPIQKEHVSPIGGDTIPPKYRVTTPVQYKSNGMGPTLTESMRERKDTLQKVHDITNGQKIKSTPIRLEDLSKEVIKHSDTKTLKDPDTATPQLTEFSLHNPGIIDSKQLDWEYEEDEDKESHGGSYKPEMGEEKVTTPTPFHDQNRTDLPMGMPSSSGRGSIRTPQTPMDTPKIGNINIRESNWRQGKSNIQNASDILKRDTIDWRRVSLPPDQKPPTNPLRQMLRYSCKFCHLKHIGRICLCMKCRWIHLTLRVSWDSI